MPVRWAVAMTGRPGPAYAGPFRRHCFPKRFAGSRRPDRLRRGSPFFVLFCCDSGIPGIEGGRRPIAREVPGQRPSIRDEADRNILRLLDDEVSERPLCSLVPSNEKSFVGVELC
jgi:hypothetical protein